MSEYRKKVGERMSKTSRLLRLWLTISKRKRFTVDQLATEFGVSYRTMLRDLNELSRMGVPLYSEPGKNGGYSLLPHPSVEHDAFVHQTPYGKVICKGDFYVIGLELSLPFTAVHASESVVPQLWQTLEQQAQQIPALIKPLNRVGLVLNRQKEYVYIAGFETHHVQHIPEQMVGVHVPTQHYAVYTHHGGWSRTAMDQTYFYINDDLEKNAYRHNVNEFWVEWYGTQSPMSRNSFVDVFVPLLNDS